jgi:hypothetical protein
MRSFLAFTALIGVSACQTTTPASIASAPNSAIAARYQPTLDTRTWRKDVAAPKTQMAVLGSAHTAQIKDFNVANLNLVLDKLAAFNPTIITQEGVSGEQCETLRANPTIYAGSADYCAGLDDAQAAVGLNFAAARAEVERLLANWPASPTPAQRRRLAALFVATGDRPSAVVQWLRLPVAERKVGDSVNDKVLTTITQAAARPSERIAIGAALAARLGHERIYPVDDQTGLSVWAGAGPGMDAAMNAHWQSNNAKSSPAMDSYKAAESRLGSGEDVLTFFRLLNTPAIQMAFIETDFRDALRLPGPSYYGQQYYTYNDIRNWRMVANILQVSGNKPGARVLNIVGASHKAYYEAYLDTVPYVELVDMNLILK